MSGRGRAAAQGTGLTRLVSRAVAEPRLFDGLEAEGVNQLITMGLPLVIPP